MSERLLPYDPLDPLFRSPAGAPRPAEPEATALPGPTLGEALDAYLAEGHSLWSPKTSRGRVRQLQYLREHLAAFRFTPMCSNLASETSCDDGEGRSARPSGSSGTSELGPTVSYPSFRSGSLGSWTRSGSTIVLDISKNSSSQNRYSGGVGSLTASPLAGDPRVEGSRYDNPTRLARCYGPAKPN